MPEEKPNTIDEYFSYLDSKFASWKPEQRLALAAGMAERWLYVYEAFSAEEDWGDPDLMRRALDAAWKHLAGEKLARHDLSRYLGLVEDSTPHMDFFDEHAALAAAFMVQEALECCASENNRAPAMQGILSGFEAVLPHWEEEIEAQPRLWKQIPVRREFENQLKLIDEIDAITHFDPAAVQALRDKLHGEEYQGVAAPAAPPLEGPVTVTNQWAFERFRAVVEVDIQQNDTSWWEDYELGSFNWAMMVFSEWSGRYGRRQQILDGEYGKLGDTLGIQALMVRNRAIDAAASGTPNWGTEMDEVVGMIAANPYNNPDVNAFDEPHSYGPSFRRLWLEAEQSGQQEPWQAIRAWKNHIPPDWAQENQRKKQGLAYAAPELGQRLERQIDWHPTNNPLTPWTADMDSETWQIRLNDFPDEILYTLLIDGEERGDFHDWPGSWGR